MWSLHQTHANIQLLAELYRFDARSGWLRLTEGWTKGLAFRFSPHCLLRMRAFAVDAILLLLHLTLPANERGRYVVV